MFNPWKHFRLAACVVLFLARVYANWSLVAVGFVLLMTGIVGGLDLAERRVELLEKFLLKEKDDEKTETPKGD